MVRGGMPTEIEVESNQCIKVPRRHPRQKETVNHKAYPQHRRSRRRNLPTRRQLPGLGVHAIDFESRLLKLLRRHAAVVVRGYPTPFVWQLLGQLIKAGAVNLNNSR